MVQASAGTTGKANDHRRVPDGMQDKTTVQAQGLVLRSCRSALTIAVVPVVSLRYTTG